MLSVPRKKDRELRDLVLAKATTKRRQRRKKHIRASYDEVIERRQQAFKLRLRGYSYKQIADKLRVGFMTIKRDLDSVKDEMGKRISQFDKDYALGRTLGVYEQIEREAWQQYNMCKDGSVNRVQFLNLIRTTRNDQAKLLMDIGLIGKAPTKVEHKLEANEALKGWTNEAKNLVALAIIRSQLPTPTEPIADPEKIIEASSSYSPEEILIDSSPNEDESN